MKTEMPIQEARDRLDRIKRYNQMFVGTLHFVSPRRLWHIIKDEWGRLCGSPLNGRS